MDAIYYILAVGIIYLVVYFAKKETVRRVEVKISAIIPCQEGVIALVLYQEDILMNYFKSDVWPGDLANIYVNMYGEWQGKIYLDDYRPFEGHKH